MSFILLFVLCILLLTAVVFYMRLAVAGYCVQNCNDVAQVPEIYIKDNRGALICWAMSSPQ